MTQPNPRQHPDVELEQSQMTRREALSDSLRPGRHLDGHRAYSTLVQRSEGPLSEPNDCRYCGQLLQQAMSHLTGHVLLDDFPPGYEALLAAVDAFPSHRVRAGGTDSDRDEPQNESGAAPNPPACAQEDQHDAD